MQSHSFVSCRYLIYVMLCSVVAAYASCGSTIDHGNDPFVTCIFSSLGGICSITITIMDYRPVSIGAAIICATITYSGSSHPARSVESTTMASPPISTITIITIQRLACALCSTSAGHPCGTDLRIGTIRCGTIGLVLLTATIHAVTSSV